MDKFEALKQAAEAKLKADDAKFNAWVTKYRWVLDIAAFLAGVIVTLAVRS